MVKFGLGFLVPLMSDAFAILTTLHKLVSNLLDPTEVLHILCEQFLNSSTLLALLLLLDFSTLDSNLKLVHFVNDILELHRVIADYPEAFPRLSRF